MTTGYRQRKFNDVAPAGRVAISYAPSFMDWRNMALDTNEMIGRGTQLVPNVVVPAFTIEGGSTVGMEIAIYPQDQTTARAWSFGAQTVNPGTEQLTVTIGTWATRTFTLGQTLNLFNLVESVPSSQIGNTVTIVPVTFSLASNATTSTGSMFSISCYGVPRYVMDYSDARDNPTINEDSFYMGAPIYHQQGANPDYSATALALAVSSSVNIVRRTSGWYFLAPCRKGSGNYATGSLTGSATQLPVLPGSGSIQMRRVFSNETSASMDVFTQMWVDSVGNVTGNLKLYTTAGVTTISHGLTTTPTWYSGSLIMLTDGSTSTSGYPDGKSDSERFSFDLWKTGGGVTGSNFYCSAICIGERSGSIGPDPVIMPTISISGQVSIGGRLTATATSYSSLQWYRSSTFGGGGTRTAIPGATGTQYTVLFADMGFDLTCDAINGYGSVTSNALNYTPESVTGVIEAWKFYNLTPGTVAAVTGSKAGLILMQPTSANKPTMGATSFAGKPGLTFDGVQTFLSSSTLFNWSAWNSQRVVTAMSMSATAGARAYVMADFSVPGYTTGSWQVGTKFDASLNDALGCDATSNGPFGVTRTGAGNAIPGGMFISYGPDTGHTNGTAFIRDNGVSQTLSNIQNTCVPGPLAANGQLLVGIDRGATQPWGGILGTALIIMSGSAQDGDLSNAEAYCANGAGLPVGMPTFRVRDLGIHNSTAIDSWDNWGSFYGNSISSTGTARPTVTTLDGLNAALFDGVNDVLGSGPAISNLVGSNTFTVVAVVRPDALTGSPTNGYDGCAIVQDGNGAGSGGNWSPIMARASGIYAAVFAGADVKTTPISVSTGTEYVVTTTWDGTTLSCTVNGSTQTTSHAGSYTQTQAIRFGANYASTAFFQGAIGEVLVYNSVLSTGDLSSAQAYLRRRFPSAV